MPIAPPLANEPDFKISEKQTRWHESHRSSSIGQRGRAELPLKPYQLHRPFMPPEILHYSVKLISCQSLNFPDTKPGARLIHQNPANPS
ncbi:MAG: hypothetical protein M2R45_00300 [Verrucomicrobia subdivision 3 bacterium]|nr:hypothetical protein [Limisphaerales bacterium]